LDKRPAKGRFRLRDEWFAASFSVLSILQKKHDIDVRRQFQLHLANDIGYRVSLPGLRKPQVKPEFRGHAGESSYPAARWSQLDVQRQSRVWLDSSLSLRAKKKCEMESRLKKTGGHRMGQ
jgi:hypothetical protein